MVMSTDWKTPDVATAGFIVPPGGGEQIPSKPNATAKASSMNTDGLLVVHEAILESGEKVARHRHDDLAECFYVLDGEILLQVGEEVVRATPGTFAFSPVNTVHGFSNISDAPARLLIVVLPPARIEEYFSEVERMPAGADAAAWARLNRAYGMEFVGPPLEG